MALSVGVGQSRRQSSTVRGLELIPISAPRWHPDSYVLTTMFRGVTFRSVRVQVKEDFDVWKYVQRSLAGRRFAMAQVKRQDQQQRTTLDTCLETDNSEGS